MHAKTERFEMRFDQQMLDQVDTWRAHQDGLPSRAEAVRRLVLRGLSDHSRKPLNISDGEQLTLLMLCDLFKHLKPRSEIDPTFVEAAIHGGHHWGFEWAYPGIFHRHKDNPAVVTEVVHVLKMWSLLEIDYGRLSKKEKARIQKEAKPFGKDMVFRGFDGNNEYEHIAIAKFLINDLNRFTVFEDRDLNSHMPSIETYRRMLRVFEPMQRNLVGGVLNASQIIKILKAMTYSDYQDS